MLMFMWPVACWAPLHLGYGIRKSKQDCDSSQHKVALPAEQPHRKRDPLAKAGSCTTLLGRWPVAGNYYIRTPLPPWPVNFDGLPFS